MPTRLFLLTKDEGRNAFVLRLYGCCAAGEKGVVRHAGSSDNLDVEGLQYGLNGVDEGGDVRAGKEQADDVVFHI